MMRKGLFGRKMPGVISGYGGGTFDMDGTQVTMNNVPTTAGGAFGNPMPAQGAMQEKPKGFWQGGDKFTGRDALAGALAAIGDGLSGWAGGRTGAVGNLLGGREEAAKLAEQQRQQAQMMAAAQGMGIDPQQAALLGPEGLRQVTVNRMKPEEGPKEGSFEWFQGATPQQIDAFRRYNDARTPDEPRMVTLPDGRAIFGTMDEIQRVIGGGQGGTAPQVLGQSLPQGWQIEGGAGGNASGNFR